MVNKFHYLKGGSEKYYFELAELLKENGHEVAFFSMEDEKNIKTGYKEYFVSPVDLNSNNKLKALDIIYSRKNNKKMKEALEDFKPDIVHLNNFQRQLSASIVDAIKEKNIPIVFTAHDIEAICPNKTMLDAKNNICEQCLNGRYFNCVKKTCIKNSKLKSILGAIETKYYRTKKIYTEKIDYIITPSEFYRKKFVEDGINPEKILTIHNFIDTENYNFLTEDEGYALYFGRVSVEKGIINLIKAFEKTQKGVLYIAGDGPEKEKIEQLIVERKLKNRIKMLGFLSKDKILEAIRKCRFTVLPSIWRDNCPYSVLETMAIGKPVIGSNNGGIPELVRDGETGLVFDSNNIDELTYKMNKLFNDSELAQKFGNNAKKLANQIYTKEYYYNEIIKIYERLIK
jgi:glycosyltransferase involved in cell wall biosynthesis